MQIFTRQFISTIDTLTIIHSSKVVKKVLMYIQTNGVIYYKNCTTKPDRSGSILDHICIVTGIPRLVNIKKCSIFWFIVLTCQSFRFLKFRLLVDCDIKNHFICLHRRTAHSPCSGTLIRPTCLKLGRNGKEICSII
jgi:hypothetical protein